MSRSAEQRRINALAALMDGGRVVAASAEALLQLAMPPEVFRHAAFTLDMSTRAQPEDVEDALLRCGYSRAVQVEGPGQFCRRGGILDFFSPAYGQPVRVEFWDDEIDLMSFFDTGSQRRTESLESCRVVPAAEVLPTLAAGGAQALGRRLEELAARVEKRRAGETGAQLAGVLREDAERLLSGAELPAADRYAALIYGGAYTALDYLPEDAVVVLDQPARFAEAARAYIKRVTEDVTSLSRAGKLLSRPEDYFIPFDAAMRRLGGLRLYMADAFTAGRYAVEPRSVTVIRAKQLPSYGGSANQAAEDIGGYVKAGFSVCVLAGDERRARLLAEFLNEHGVRCGLASQLKSLPEQGSCTVTAGSLSAGIEYPRCAWPY